MEIKIMRRISLSHKNVFKQTPKIIVKIVNAVQSCCVVALGMSIYHDNKTFLYIVSSISIICHFINTYTADK